MAKLKRVIISGGGTGGHIFPAISIADEIKKRNPNAKILFVGAIGKMEMHRVPKAGYKITGLPISGFQRKFTLSNFLLPFKILKSLLKARKIIKKFKPQLVIGVGGYASGPTLKMANWLKIPTVIQEQNSFPGKTNRILSKSASSICCAYEGVKEHFPPQKVVITGNPIRNNVIDVLNKKQEAIDFFGLDSSKKTILVIGGSLGARSLNKCIRKNRKRLNDSEIQVIWQCGKLYHASLSQLFKLGKYPNIYLHQFIDRMDLAYAAADYIISRSGAISVSELCAIGKPVILVPSPNVTDDHQTKNAMELVERGAALLVKDSEVKEHLIDKVFMISKDKELSTSLGVEISKLSITNASEKIVDVCEKAY